MALRAKAEGYDATAEAMEDLLKSQGHWDLELFRKGWEEAYARSNGLNSETSADDPLHFGRRVT